MNKPVREGFVEAGATEVAVEHPQPAPASASVPAPVEDQPRPIEDDKWPMVIKLEYKSIKKSPTETVDELIFREPSASDIMRAGGNPCRIEITEIVGQRVIYNPIIDDTKMMRIMANLSGILEPYLQTMDPRDYNSAAYRLRRFFLPAQGIW